jgi:hypothetical protein
MRAEVVEAGQVLDVDGGDDRDARRQDVQHVLPALGPPAPGDVGVGQLVDQGPLRVALDQRLDVQLLEGPTLVGELAGWDGLEALEHLVGPGPPVGLGDADDHVGAPCPSPLALPEHGVGLAHSGCGSQVHRAPRVLAQLGVLLGPERVKRRLGDGTAGQGLHRLGGAHIPDQRVLLRHAPIVRHDREPAPTSKGRGGWRITTMSFNQEPDPSHTRFRSSAALLSHPFSGQVATVVV